MSSTEKPKIGELLVKEALITPEQLEEALLIQQNQKAYVPLGDICVEMKFLTKATLKRVLEKYKKNIMLGDLLLKLNLITDDQLQQALVKQKLPPGKLGETLIKMGFITEASLVNTLSIQMGVPKINPDLSLIDGKLIVKMNKDFLLKNEILPAFKEGNVLTVIMGNPLDDSLITNLIQVYKCKIEPAIAPAADIRKAIENYYQKVSQQKTAVIPDVKKDLVIGDEDLSQGGTDNAVSIFNYLITDAIKEEASDIHIEPKERNIRVRYRIDGILQHKTDLPISLAPKIISRIKILSRIDISEKRRHQDGRIEAMVFNQEVDLRVSTYASIYGENVVIRILPRRNKLIDLDLLGFSPANRVQFQQHLDQTAGIVLITGPTGSGKTTALYAALNYLNNGQNSIITVEDPVEYIMDGITQGQLDTNIGQNFEDFLKSMMRQDPDVIMLGEIRDSAGARAAVQAALTGHKVLTTFHADDTTGTLLRLLDMGIEPYLISSAVNVVVSQRLVRVLCEHCRKRYMPDQYMSDSFNIQGIDSDRFTFYQPHGCSQCGNKGFKGRTAVHELLVVSDAVRDALMKRKTSADMRLTARYNAGLISMREDGFYKATLGITSLEEVLRLVYYSEGEEGSSSRSAEEIIALCEGNTSITQQVESTPTPQMIPAPKYENLISVSDSIPPPPLLEGDVYRIRFDATTVETETVQIADLFKEIQKIMAKMGKNLDSDLLADFIDSIIYSIKRLEISFKAEFVELCLQVKGGKVKILLETLIPQKPASPTFYASKETGLRLINILMPSAGPQKALSTESSSLNRGVSYRKRTPLIELMKQKEMEQSQYKENGEVYQEALTSGVSGSLQLHDASYARRFGLYKKHVEELELSDFLGNQGATLPGL